MCEQTKPAGHDQRVEALFDDEFEHVEAAGDRDPAFAEPDDAHAALSAEPAPDPAYHDALTGLPNGAAADALLEEALASDAAAGRQTGFIQVELEPLAELDHAYGRQAGETVLALAIDRLNRVFRDEGIVCRSGEASFSVILPRLDDCDGVARLAQQASDALGKPAFHKSKSVSISARVGVAVSKHGDSDGGALARHACLALDEASTEDAPVAVFSPAILESHDQRHLTLTDARRGLIRNEFCPHFQPILDTRTLKVCGFEALMRWHHPFRGVLKPEVFSAALEDQGLAVRLGDRLIDQAFSLMSEWIEQGVDFQRVSINLAPAQLFLHGYAQNVLQRLHYWRVPTDKLMFEIKEEAYLGWGADAVIENLRCLHDAGVSIALDNFGTGPVSLARIRSLPVSFIKIDRSIMQDRKGHSVVSGILQIASGMNLRVIAEGVEHPTQLLALQDTDCYAAQGFLFSLAMDAERVPDCVRYYAMRAPGGLRYDSHTSVQASPPDER